MNANVINVAYLIASLTFIFGLRLLSSPITARYGNRVAAAGMALAVAAALLSPDLRTSNFLFIIPAIIIGAVLGSVGARTVKMTAMPQMVAIFNGMGGGAAATVAALEFYFRTHGGGSLQQGELATIALGAIIGCVSFSGSLIAFLKLQEIMGGGAIKYRFSAQLNTAFALVLIGLAAVITFATHSLALLLVIAALALIFGLVLVVPIGGADMPVVISLMNSLTGVAVALAGFVLNNELLIVSGSLVGASGTLLTQLMAKAMNRPITNVLFGGFGVASGSGPADGQDGGRVRSTSVDDAATLMTFAHQVVIVPGYGLAVAQAQHQAREVADMLTERGVTVKYAIHPVAGRMPGHMNVLLAEADVPYDQVLEMDDINGEFPSTDVVLVVGANDIVNPGARDDPSCEIYGMPILNVDQAAQVIVLKRSMRPGFAGIDNPLFLNPKTSMLFGDAKDSLTKLAAAIKSLSAPIARETSTPSKKETAGIA